MPARWHDPGSIGMALAGLAGSLLLAGFARGQPPAPAPALVEPRFRAGVELVRLSVTARDDRGALVHDLAPEDFRVLEDGALQQVEVFGHHEAPISAVVLFDRSSSMADEKLMHAKDAVVNFVAAFRPQDEVLVIAFSDSIDVLGQFGLEARTIEREVKKIRVQSTTRLYDAVVEAADAIATPERKEKRALVILSDGEDTASAAKLAEAAEAVRRAGVPAYAIGIELAGDAPGSSATAPLWHRIRGEPALDALRRLTDGTGGWTYPIAAAKRCKEVCIRIADELRHQYLIGYSSTSPEQDGRWRAVTVRATRPGVTLTTRAGYYARGPR